MTHANPINIPNQIDIKNQKLALPSVTCIREGRFWGRQLAGLAGMSGIPAEMPPCTVTATQGCVPSRLKAEKG